MLELSEHLLSVKERITVIKNEKDMCCLHSQLNAGFTAVNNINKAHCVYIESFKKVINNY